MKATASGRPKLFGQARSRLPFFLTVQRSRSKKDAKTTQALRRRSKPQATFVPIDESLICDNVEKKKRKCNPVAHPGCKALLAEKGSGSLVEEQQRERTKRVPHANSGTGRQRRTLRIGYGDFDSGVRGATGPRTQRGKQKSKSNALKHGIFSKVVLLKEEPRAEFDSLLRGLRNDFKSRKEHSKEFLSRILPLACGANVGCSLRRERKFGRNGVSHICLREAPRRRGELTFELESLGLLSGAENPVVLKKCLELLGNIRGKNREGWF